MSYNGIGNITGKDDIYSGSWSYTNQSGCTAYSGYTQPHAVRKIDTGVYCYDENGNQTKRGGDDVTWYSYNLPNLIEQGSNTSHLYYGAGREHYKQVSGAETTIYVGGIFEKVTESGQPTEYKHYVQAAGQTVALYTRYSSGTPSSKTMYLLHDHLGSIDKITDDAGAVLVSLSYDAFGRRRKSDWTAGEPTSSEWAQINATTHRGFTGHEHLDSVDLIHMNGRVYDPVIGRFTAADPVLPAAVDIGITATMSFGYAGCDHAAFAMLDDQLLNRYTYGRNSPLHFTDPNGFAIRDDGHIYPVNPVPSSYSEPPKGYEEIQAWGHRDMTVLGAWMTSLSLGWVKDALREAAKNVNGAPLNSGERGGDKDQDKSTSDQRDERKARADCFQKCMRDRMGDGIAAAKKVIGFGAAALGLNAEVAGGTATAAELGGFRAGLTVGRAIGATSRTTFLLGDVGALGGEVVAWSAAAVPAFIGGYFLGSAVYCSASCSD